MGITTVLSVGSVAISFAALALSAVVFWMQRADKRARIKIADDGSTWFAAEVRDMGYDDRIIDIAEMYISVTNGSDRGNTLKRIEFFSNCGLAALPADARYIIGHRLLDLMPLLGIEDTRITSEYWTPPQPDWQAVAPCALAPFQTKTAYACFELESRDALHTPSVTVTVHDALDRKYEKTFYLRQRLCDAPAVPVSSDASTQSE